MTNRRPNMLSNPWRFNTFADCKMLGEKFETWPANPLSNAILVIVGMHVTNMDYLKDKSPHFTELSNGSMKELNRLLVRLDIAVLISQTDN